jgi:hypothetical protein
LSGDNPLEGVRFHQKIEALTRRVVDIGHMSDQESPQTFGKMKPGFICLALLMRLFRSAHVEKSYDLERAHRYPNS